jgi:hypothetical protein
MDGQEHCYGKPKGHSFNTACCYSNQFPLHHQTVTDKFFLIFLWQHWFPNKLLIDQILSTSFLAVKFFFLSVDLGTSNTLDFFQSNFLTPKNIYGIRHFPIVPHFTLSSAHLQRRIQSHYKTDVTTCCACYHPRMILGPHSGSILGTPEQNVECLPNVNEV